MIIQARVTFRAEWDEFVDVEVPDDADRFDAEKLRDQAVDRHYPTLPHGREELEHTAWAGDPTFAPDKPDEPPFEAWGQAHGQWWATDGYMAIRRDCPVRPRRTDYLDWRVPPPDFLGILVKRVDTDDVCPSNRVLPLTPEATRNWKRYPEVLAAGEVRYRGDMAMVFAGDDELPIAVVMLCKTDGAP